MTLLVKSCFFLFLALIGMCRGTSLYDLYDEDSGDEYFDTELAALLSDKALEIFEQYDDNSKEEVKTVTVIPETYLEKAVKTTEEISQTFTETFRSIIEDTRELSTEESTTEETPELNTEESSSTTHEAPEPNLEESSSTTEECLDTETEEAISTITEIPETYTTEFTTEVQNNLFNYEWSDQAGRWMKYHATPASWEEARMTCHSEGAILASPLTNKLKTAIESFVLKQGDNEDNGVTIFTGVHATFSNGDYASVEGVPLSRLAILWASGEPNNLGNSERCVAMTVQHFGVEADTSCERKLPYVCYKRDPAKEYRFDYEWSEKAQGWLKYHMIPVTWDEAKPRCEAEGAVLASPVDTQLEDAIITFVQNQDNFNEGVTIFTGFPKTYKFVESDEIYSHYFWGYRREEKCTAMKIEYNGTTLETGCDTVLPYVCYKKKTELTVTKCGTIDTAYEFEPRTGSCYKFHNKNATWSKAYMTCAAEGGYLAIINNDIEAEAIREIFARYPTGVTAGFNENMLNVGINDWGHHGALFMTIHGESLEDNFHGWYPGQPNHNSIPYLGLYEESCGSVDRDVTIHDNFCNAASVFLCEKKPKSLFDGYEV